MGEKKKNEMVGLDLARCLPNHGLFQFQMYMVNTLIGCTFYFFFFVFFHVRVLDSSLHKRGEKKMIQVFRDLNVCQKQLLRSGTYR